MFLFLLCRKTIPEDMVTAYGKNATFYTLFKKWSAEFTRGRDCIQDDDL